MPDPRETARAWLAERFRAVEPRTVCTEPPGALCELVCRTCIADAILGAEGVEVEAEPVPRPAAGWVRCPEDAPYPVPGTCLLTDRWRWDDDGDHHEHWVDSSPAATPHERVVIRLPAQPIGETT
jgi:hypothetical protein